jgi:hypothetical protein
MVKNMMTVRHPTIMIMEFGFSWPNKISQLMNNAMKMENDREGGRRIKN